MQHSTSSHKYMVNDYAEEQKIRML